MRLECFGLQFFAFLIFSFCRGVELTAMLCFVNQCVVACLAALSRCMRLIRVTAACPTGMASHPEQLLVFSSSLL